MGGFFGGGGASVDLASPPAIGNTTPNTGAFTTLSFAPANNTTGFSNTSNSLTGSNAQSLVNLAQTWNTTGTPTAIKLNVTDTASNASSLLIDLQRGGSSVFSINKLGGITFGGSANTSIPNAIVFPTGYGNTFKIESDINNGIMIVGQGSTTQIGSQVRVTATTTAGYVWRLGASQLLAMMYDADNILAQRNSTNAQTFRLYNTFTSATNFERLNFRWASNEFILDAEKGSAGGTLRGIKIGSATSSLLGFYGVTPVDQPATVTDPTGGGTQDAEARTAINAIIDRLQELGLIA
jgi:hypothetical protein